MSFLTLLSQISIFSILWIDLNSEIHLGFNDTLFNKYFKIFIFTY